MWWQILTNQQIIRGDIFGVNFPVKVINLWLLYTPSKNLRFRYEIFRFWYRIFFGEFITYKIFESAFRTFKKSAFFRVRYLNGKFWFFFVNAYEIFESAFGTFQKSSFFRVRYLNGKFWFFLWMHHRWNIWKCFRNYSKIFLFFKVKYLNGQFWFFFVNASHMKYLKVLSAPFIKCTFYLKFKRELYENKHFILNTFLTVLFDGIFC